MFAHICDSGNVFVVMAVRKQPDMDVPQARLILSLTFLFGLWYFVGAHHKAFVFLS